MSDTRTKILDLSETLTQKRGFGGFSYLDLADEIGIKTASIHYHFRCKDDLAVALVERSCENMAQKFAELEAGFKSPKKRIEALIEHFKSYVTTRKFCMCGMMAAELYALSPQVQELLNGYFEQFQTWLSAQFKAMDCRNPKMQALRFLSMAEGALLLARLRDDATIIRPILKEFLTR